MPRTIYSPKHNSYRQVFYGERPQPRPADSPDYVIHTYDSPVGLGYELQYTRRRAGRNEEKRVNIGPEKHREHDWREKVDAEIKVR